MFYSGGIVLAEEAMPQFCRKVALIGRVLSRLLLSCLIVVLTSIELLEAQDGAATISREGYPIPVLWEVTRLPCTNAPLAMCVSRDGKTLYADDFNGLVTVWDLTTRTKVRDLPQGENNNVERLVLSRDGSRLASCSGNGVVHVWDLKSGQLIHESHPAPNYADMAISPDGKTILTSGLDNPVRLIDIDTGKVLSEFKLAEATHNKPGTRDGLWNITFLDDSKYGVGNGVGLESFVFDTATGAVKAKLPKTKLIGLDATGKWLIGGDVSGLMFWSLDDIKKACAAPTPQMVTGVSVPGVNAAHLAALTTIPYDHWSLGSADSSAATAIDPRWGLVWPVYGDEPRSFGPIVDAVSPDGHYLYESWYKDQIRILDLTKRPLPTQWLTGPFCHNFAADSAHGYLATGNLIAWERGTGLPLGCASLERPPPDCFVYWQNGVPFELRQILNPKAKRSSDDFTPPPDDVVILEKINLQTWAVVQEVPLQANVHLTVSQSGKFVLMAYQSPPVHFKNPPDPKNPRAFFDPANMQMTPPLQVLDSDLNSVGTGFTVVPNQGINDTAISPTDKLVAGRTQNEKDTIRIFDLQSGHEVSTQPLILDHVVDFGVTDDGFIFVATTSGDLSCYHADTGQKIASVDKAHARPIRKIAVSPDNKVIATAGTDGLIKLWSMPDLKPLGTFDSPGPLGQEGILSFGFYDSKQLVVVFCNEPTEKSRLCLIPLPQAFDESKWNVNASAEGGRCLAISSDGKQVAIGDLKGNLTFVDNSTGKQLYSVMAHSGRVEAVEFVPNSYQVKTYGADNKCRTWDLANSSQPISVTSEARPETVLDIQTGTGPKKIGPHPLGFPNSMTVSPSSGPYTENEISPNYHFGFTCACTLPGGQYMVLSNLGGLYLYSLKTERLVWAYDIPSNATAIVYDPLHQQFITTHEDGVTRRWDLPSMVKSSLSP